MNLHVELKKLGLSDKESSVYLALLEKGQSSVQETAKRAQVNRATTYVVLDSLMKRGIVTTVEEGGKMRYAAEDPRSLLRFFRVQETEIQEKEEEFKKAMPELDALFNLSGNRPRVRYFEGKEGMQAAREDLLLSGAKEVLDIYSFDEVQEIFPKDQKDETRERRMELGIKVRAIYTSKKGPFRGFKSKSERKFVPYEKFPFKGDISVYGSRVALTTLTGKLFTVIIENEEMADTMRLIFELAWLGANQDRE